MSTYSSVYLNIRMVCCRNPPTGFNVNQIAQLPHKHPRVSLFDKKLQANLQCLSMIIASLLPYTALLLGSSRWIHTWRLHTCAREATDVDRPSLTGR